MEFHVIGAGIAGLTAAYSLASHNPGGKHKIHIYEKEQLPCMFSSSRNAAIFRTYESDPSLSLLVKNSYRELLEIEKTAGPLVDRRGLLIDPLELDYYENSFIDKFPGLSALKGIPETYDFGDRFTFNGIMVRQNGVMDIHAYQNYLVRILTQKGAIFHYRRSVEKIIIHNEKIIEMSDNHGVAIRLSDDDIVVNAAGSWAMNLVSSAGAWTPPVIPFKRHLFFLRGKPKTGAVAFQRGAAHGVATGQNIKQSRPQMPVLWNEKRDVYIRPEGDGFLATHCDQREVEPGDYASDEKEVDRFLHSILSVFSFLNDHHISRYWACLRTFSLDQIPVIGFDPYIKNLFWMAGLGGRGMTMSPGLVPEIGRLIYEPAAGAMGTNDHNPFSPKRFC